MKPLSGRVVLVVGASSGMGRATVEVLAEQGAQVMAAARREQALTELVQKYPDTVRACVMDVKIRQQVANLIASTEQVWGKVDVLVYATGTNVKQRRLEELSQGDWDLLLSTNLNGAFYCTQEVLPLMRRQGHGLIIYISTAAVQRPDVSGVAYQASKHGLTGLAHGTRVEERDHGIRTSLVFAGLCETEILQQRPVPTPRELLDQALQPDDVAQAVLFLTMLPPRASVPEMQLVPSRLW